MDEETHGARVRRLRKALGMTQADLEVAAKVDQSTLSGIEKRNAMPQADTLLRIARALNTTPEYVLEGKASVWPFETVAMERFMALPKDERRYVEGRLESIIESRETTTDPERTTQPLPNSSVTGTKKAPVRLPASIEDRTVVGGKRAVDQSGAVQKKRRRGST